MLGMSLVLSAPLFLGVFWSHVPLWSSWYHRDYVQHRVHVLENLLFIVIHFRCSSMAREMWIFDAFYARCETSWEVAFAWQLHGEKVSIVGLRHQDKMVHKKHAIWCIEKMSLSHWWKAHGGLQDWLWLNNLMNREVWGQLKHGCMIYEPGIDTDTAWQLYWKFCRQLPFKGGFGHTLQQTYFD